MAKAQTAEAPAPVVDEAAELRRLIFDAPIAELAEHQGISIDEAEQMKKDLTKENDVFPIIRPVVQKMASIVKRFLEGFDVDRVYVVGGASCFTDFESTFEKELGITTVKTNDALLVTPLGIAWNAAVIPE